MAWDEKTGRRRQGSNAAANGSSHQNLPLHIRQQPRRPSQGGNALLADPFLQEFLDSSFDPSDFLNTTLDPLQAPGRSGHGAVPLAELSTEAQTLISQLNAHTTCLGGSLTQLTDDIMRSGSRLAYEVELLRGETMGLAEALSEGLEDDISKFTPGGVLSTADAKPHASLDPGRETQSQRDPSTTTTTTTTTSAPISTDQAGVVLPLQPQAPTEPSHIAQLRTLTLVRSRLDSVIKTFGDAMEFVFPPSELSVSSSFLSVSAPDPGSEMHSTEEKGRQILQGLREEIARLLDNKEDPVKGIEDAARRIEELKDLAKVWKGTAEEKGRNKFIEGLAKTVEDRHRDLMREMEQSSRGEAGQAGALSVVKEGDGNTGDSGQDNRGYGGYGLISQLQKLRSGL